MSRAPFLTQSAASAWLGVMATTPDFMLAAAEMVQDMILSLDNSSLMISGIRISFSPDHFSLLYVSGFSTASRPIPRERTSMASLVMVADMQMRCLALANEVNWSKGRAAGVISIEDPDT